MYIAGGGSPWGKMGVLSLVESKKNRAIPWENEKKAYYNTRFWKKIRGLQLPKKSGCFRRRRAYISTVVAHHFSHEWPKKGVFWAYGQVIYQGAEAKTPHFKKVSKMVQKQENTDKNVKRRVKKIIKPCGVCGHQTEVYPRLFKYWHNVYCSKKCQKKQQSIRSMARASKKAQRVKKHKTCVICNAPFQKNESIHSTRPQKTCGGVECQRKQKLGHHLRTLKKCLYCENQVWIPPASSGKTICGAKPCKQAWERENKKNRASLHKIEVFLYHKQGGLCRRCKTPIKAWPQTDYERDHILPVHALIKADFTKKMINSPENIALLCKPCHRKKPQKVEKCYGYINRL